jgi:hypothetical protein
MMIQQQVAAQIGAAAAGALVLTINRPETAMTQTTAE